MKQWLYALARAEVHKMQSLARAHSQTHAHAGGDSLGEANGVVNKRSVMLYAVGHVLSIRH